MNTWAFQNHILAWHTKHGRHLLPWRPPAGKQVKQSDPYKILVSEVMLQQTQVPRVIPKYKLFIKTFPTIEKLARAKTPLLLKIWQGLGYNRRALYLRETARAIARDCGGAFPRDAKTLEALPGIGPSTARAIAVFAWNQPEIFIETNIRRVFIHFFFKHKKKVSDRDILPLIQKTLYHKNPRMWYSALMDYGAMLGETLQEENPNRKSSQYTTQSTFIGSNRYARAKILAFVLLRPSTTQKSIMSYMNKNPALKPLIKKAPQVLHTLADEGFLRKRGRYWKIADSSTLQ